MKRRISYVTSTVVLLMAVLLLMAPSLLARFVRYYDPQVHPHVLFSEGWACPNGIEFGSLMAGRAVGDDGRTIHPGEVHNQSEKRGSHQGNDQKRPDSSRMAREISCTL